MYPFSYLASLLHAFLFGPLPYKLCDALWELLKAWVKHIYVIVSKKKQVLVTVNKLSMLWLQQYSIKTEIS